MSPCQLCSSLQRSADHGPVPPLGSGCHDGRTRPVHLPLPGASSLTVEGRRTLSLVFDCVTLLYVVGDFVGSSLSLMSADN